MKTVITTRVGDKLRVIAEYNYLIPLSIGNTLIEYVAGELKDFTVTRKGLDVSNNIMYIHVE